MDREAWDKRRTRRRAWLRRYRAAGRRMERRVINWLWLCVLSTLAACIWWIAVHGLDSTLNLPRGPRVSSVSVVVGLLVMAGAVGLFEFCDHIGRRRTGRGADVDQDRDGQG